MRDVKVLDVTLRDGGCVNNFNFGKKYMSKILSAQETAGIDIIELGYIDDKNGSLDERTMYTNEKVIYKNFLKNKKRNISYVVMMDFGKFDVKNLEYRNENSIDGIRLAFHKKNVQDMIEVAKNIIEKGYDLYLQPMITLRYSDFELLELIDIVNKELANSKAFYIVDSFGEMKNTDLLRLINLVNHNLDRNIAVGLHSHNNMQMSYSNAMTLLSYPTQRSIIIDSSIMGMGKGAGNLNTELILGELYSGGKEKYNIQPLLEVIDKVIEPIHTEFYWGYSVEYYLSALNGCTPSYAAHFYKKHTMTIDCLSELLSRIDDDKKISFDKEYAENLYRKYNERKSVDDNEILENIKNDIIGKDIFIVAPGKSIEKEKNKVERILKKNNIVSFGLNIIDDFNFDYVVITRKELLEKAINSDKRVIVPSNLVENRQYKNMWIIDYKRWIDVDDQVHDSSSVLLLNLLTELNVKELCLAGFDGFSSLINYNYYDYTLRNSLDENQAKNRNDYYKKFIDKIVSNGIKINFLTESMYR